MSEETKGLTRRNFLSGAAVAGAALAGMAGLSACSPSTASSSDDFADTATTTSGTTVGYDGTGTMPWLGEAPTIDESAIEETVDADVVVVGLGCAGVPAARAAAEAGA